MNGHPHHLIQGLWCASLTPLSASGAIDNARFAAHVQWLFGQGVAGVAPFGTTGEGQSFSVDERRAGLDALLASVPAQRVLPGTGCASLSDRRRSGSCRRSSRSRTGRRRRASRPRRA